MNIYLCHAIVLYLPSTVNESHSVVAFLVSWGLVFTKVKKAKNSSSLAATVTWNCKNSHFGMLEGPVAARCCWVVGGCS